MRMAPIAPARLGHVRLATITAPASAKPLTTGASAPAGFAFVGEVSAGSRRLAGDVEQILDADDRSVEPAGRHAVLGAGIRDRRRPRGFGLDRQAASRLSLSDRRSGPALVRGGHGIDKVHANSRSFVLDGKIPRR